MKRSYATIPYILGILLYVFTKQVDGQILKVGACPTITPVAIAQGNNPFQNPSVGSLQGAVRVWTEVQRFVTLWENSLRCVTYTFTQTSVVNAVPVTNSVTISGRKRVLGNGVTITGTNAQTANGNIFTAAYTTTAAGGLFFSNIYPTSYTVAGTDSSIVPTVIVLYSCEAVGLLNMQSAWVLVSAGFNQAAINAAIASARAAGVPTQFFKTSPAC